MEGRQLKRIRGENELKVLSSCYGFIRRAIAHFSDERAIVILLDGGAETRSIDCAELPALEAAVNRLAHRWKTRVRAAQDRFARVGFNFETNTAACTAPKCRLLIR